MARICDRCGRGSNRGFTRSHSNIATKHQQFANLQTKRIGGLKQVLCTRCLKTLDRTLAKKVAEKTTVSKAKKAPAKAKK